MPPVICRKCGEDNPAEAVMCWACYTPISGREGESNTPPTAANQVLWSIASGASVVVPAVLIVAGCLRSRGALRTLFCFLGAVLASLHICRISLERAADQKRANADDGDLSPIERIANAILIQAVKDKASSIRVQAFQRGCAVHYLIQGEWREQMKVPKYIWKPLMSHLRLRAGLLDDVSERGAMNVTVNNTSQLMSYSYDTETETVLLENV